MKQGEITDGRYRILRMINEKTAEAEEIQTGRKVILKRERPQSFSLPVHPYVCRNEEILETAEGAVSVCPFVPGRTLREEIARVNVMEPEEAAGILIPLTEVLEDLSKNDPSWIFGDLKPSNLILNGKKIILIDTESLFPVSYASSLGRYATKGYAAPEQFGPDAYADIRSSVYSIGSMMFLMITGKSLKDCGYMIRPAGMIREELKGSAAERIVLKCLKTDPAGRYQDMASLREALRSIKKD